MANAADVQIDTGPSATIVHHAAAWVQDTTGLDAVWSLFVAIVGGGAVVATVTGLSVAAVVHLPRLLRR